MLEIQKFLQTAAPAELTAQLGIKVKPHPVYPNLLHFSYDQIESPKAHPIVHECRGLILDSTNDWKVIAYPFNRFPNHGETWGPPVDWSTACVQEKVDGSLMVLWHYQDCWNVSTKGSPDAGGQVGDFNFTFAELFWETMKERYFAGTDIDLSLQPHFTYMWELTSIYNRVVCSYGEETKLTLIGVRDIETKTYLEWPVHLFQGQLPIPVVKHYMLQSVDDIMKAAEALNPMQNEGFVVVDGKFNRCKIKSPSYVMIHHLKDGMGQRRIIRLIQLGEESEVLSYFPEYQQMFFDIKELIDAKLTEIDIEYDRIKDLSTQKEFAVEASKKKYSSTLFLMRQLGIDARTTILSSKKLINKGTAEAYRYNEVDIEFLIGLKTPKVLVPVGEE